MIAICSGSGNQKATVPVSGSYFRHPTPFLYCWFMAYIVISEQLLNITNSVVSVPFIVCRWNSLVCCVGGMCEEFDKRTLRWSSFHILFWLRHLVLLGKQVSSRVSDEHSKSLFPLLHILPLLANSFIVPVWHSSCRKSWCLVICQVAWVSSRPQVVFCMQWEASEMGRVLR